MDLRRMAHVVALADERHFGRAAERCNLSQPAFSRSVQAAESELGMRLFDRSGLDIRCTPAGSFVVERARQLLFDSRCLERDVGHFRSRQLGDLAFGVGPFPAVTLLPPLVMRLRVEYPGINTRVEVNNWVYLLEHLRAEELDFFLADVRDVPAAPDVLVMPLGEQRGGFYVRAGHPLLAHAGASAIAPAAMAAYGLATVRLPQAVKAQLRALLGLQAAESAPIRLECDDVRLLMHVALGSDTVLGATREALAQELKTGQLQPLTIEGMPYTHSTMGLVTLKGRSLSPMAERAVQLLSEGREAAQAQG